MRERGSRSGGPRRAEASQADAPEPPATTTRTSASRWRKAPRNTTRCAGTGVIIDPSGGGDAQRRSAAMCGCEPNPLRPACGGRGHSARIGGATDHFAQATPPAVLQICGRWDSDLWQIYTRQCIEQTIRYTVQASACTDASLEEIFDDYTQPADTAQLC